MCKRFMSYFFRVDKGSKEKTEVLLSTLSICLPKPRPSPPRIPRIPPPPPHRHTEQRRYSTKEENVDLITPMIVGMMLTDDGKPTFDPDQSQRSLFEGGESGGGGADRGFDSSSSDSGSSDSGSND